MIWLTLRQFRVQAAMVLGGLVVLCAALALTRPELVDDYSSGLASCGSADSCDQFAQSFFESYQTRFGALIVIVICLPGLIGIFWGAPLITREIEHNTHRLVWNQSITRTRWLAVKLGLIGLVAVVAAGLTVLVADWWSDPLDKAAVEQAPRLSPVVFAARGVVPIGYAAFAFVLGVTVGILVRRTLPTMAITLVVFIVVQVAMPTFVRAHIIPPETRTVKITEENHGEISLRSNETSTNMVLQVEIERGAWTLSNQTVTTSGKKVTQVPITRSEGAPCAPPPPGPDGEPPRGPSKACFDYLAAQGYRQKVSYQPADRFWPLQWAELGLFGVLTAGLTGFCFYWTRRRLS